MIAEPRFLPRLLAMLILSGLVVLIWAAVLRPAIDWKARAFAGLAASQSENTLLSTSISQLKVERAQLSEGTSLDIIWKAKRLGEATAMVQSQISSLAAQRGVMLRSVTPVPTQDIPFAIAIGFRIEGEATLDKLTAFVIAVEASSPALVIERAVLRRLTRPGRTSPQPVIFLQLTLIAPATLDEEGGT